MVLRSTRGLRMTVAEIVDVSLGVRYRWCSQRSLPEIRAPGNLLAGNLLLGSFLLQKSVLCLGQP